MSERVLPARVAPPAIFLSSISPDTSPGRELPNFSAPTLASAAWAATNRAYYVPFTLRSSVTVYRFFWSNGTTSATTKFQVGVYTDTLKAIKIGTQTTAAGVSAPQFDNIADFSLPKGRYYMAMHGDGTGSHIIRGANNFFQLGAAGLVAESSLTSGLQATATAVAYPNNYLPIFGLALRSAP